MKHIKLFNFFLTVKKEDHILYIYRVLSDVFNKDGKVNVINKENIKERLNIASATEELVNKLFDLKNINMSLSGGREDSSLEIMLSNPRIFPLYEDINRIWGKTEYVSLPTIEAVSVGYVLLNMDKEKYFGIVDKAIKMKNLFFFTTMLHIYYGENLNTEIMANHLNIKSYTKYENGTVVFKFKEQYNGMNIYYIYNRQHSPFLPFEIFRIIRTITALFNHDDFDFNCIHKDNTLFSEEFNIQPLNIELVKNPNMFIKDDKYIELTFEDGNGNLLGDDNYNFDFVQGSLLVNSMIERQSLFGIKSNFIDTWEII